MIKTPIKLIKNIKQRYKKYTYWYKKRTKTRGSSKVEHKIFKKQRFSCPKQYKKQIDYSAKK